MEFIKYLRLLRRHWLLIVVSVVLSGGVAWVVTMRQTPQYRASITMFVSAADRTTNSSTAYQASLLSQERVKSYANLLKSERIASKLSSTLNGGLSAENLQARISAEAIPETVLLRAMVVDESPARAKSLADALGVEFVALVQELERPPGDARPLVKVTVVDDAQVPTAPVSPQPLLNLMLGLLAGFAIGVGGSLLREDADSSVKSGDDLRRLTGGAVLGTIRYDGAVSKRPNVGHGAMHTPRAEAFRFLRANLQFVDVDEPVRLVVITSALPKEGRSLTTCDLAVALAQAGKRVIVVDADLRKPRIARYLGVDGTAGLTSVLVGHTGLDDALQQWRDLPLFVLSSGPVPPNPGELLGSQHMQKLLLDVRDRADIVLLDTPPLLPVADATVLARNCDGAVMIARHGRTQTDELRSGVERLRAADVRLLGSVLNMVPAKHELGYSRAGDFDRPADSLTAR
ncbi:polysaccharide biosynthesis tyrosine autokinase [Actinomadura sp. HBU206391]|uniref:polysaccharide biosynthesis tyrosine autokinase n=1 Tax=Actinomadura sp. HBU206391 TaxID=2731692 RepID=UPI00164FABDB|nr:polysaccharide biosynthesis tyrosine autokinase [Actinomadura sp. HBU206391]MBC6456846.1 polysaccharide biosynthesis tyrosine autokinase [Actinomadura sp. HBU206391]